MGGSEGSREERRELRMEQRRKVIEEGERERKRKQGRCNGGVKMWRMGESEQREAAAKN